MRVLADENFRDEIVAGLLRRVDVAILTVAAAGLRQGADEEVLAFAAENDMLVLSHDWRTMQPLAWDRVRRGLPMPGLIVVPWGMRPGAVIAVLEVLLGAGTPTDFRDQVIRL